MTRPASRRPRGADCLLGRNCAAVIPTTSTFAARSHERERCTAASARRAPAVPDGNDLLRSWPTSTA
jgi:hypothetical protein